MAQSRVLQILINAKDNTTGALKKAEGASKAFAFGMLGVGASIAGAVKHFSKYESTMSAVKAITNSSSDDMERLEATAKKMGAETAFNAKEAGEGMKFLGMAGFQTDEIIQAIPGTLSLASAANIELGRTADIASNVLTSFNLEAKDTDKVVDVLAKTISSSNTDLDQMAEAMKYFAPTASAFGISLEEASATIGILGNAGLQGSIATTALSTSLTRLANPVGDMGSWMAEIGLEAFNAKGEFIGMTEMVKQLEQGLVGFSEKNKQAALSSIFGAEALKGMNVLVSAGSEELQKYTNTLEESKGMAKKMADEQLNNLNGAMTLLMSAVSGVAIEIGNKLTPFIRELTEKITQIIPNVLIFINYLKENKSALLFLSIVVISALIPSLMALMATLYATASALAPFILGGVIIGGIVAGIHYLVTNWEEAKIKIIEFFEKIKEKWNNFLIYFNEKFPILSGLIKILIGNFLLILDAVKLMWKGIKVVWQSGSDFIKSNIEAIKGAVDTLVNKLKQALEFLKKVSGFNIISNVAQKAGSLISGARATGGSVSSGGSYLVGERGAEIFTPNTSGTITPNNKINGLGGGKIINITINGDVSGDEIVEKVKNGIMNDLSLNTKFSDI